jgi:hypothetical protein
MLERELWHPSITVERVMEAAQREMFELDNQGFCLICGEEAEGCEPDARNNKCDNCGAEQVFGAEEIILSM